MFQVGDRSVPAIALVGVESVGKSTLAHMLTGRLRTHGVQAVLVAEPGAAMPFDAALHDTAWQAWVYGVTSKIAAESAAALRPSTGLIVSDRTPFDHLAYYRARMPGSPHQRELTTLAASWACQYDAIYYLRAEGTTYVEDGHRAPLKHNTWRGAVDRELATMLARHAPGTVIPTGTQRERAEYVYHHVLGWLLGRTKVARAYEQVRAWFAQRGWKILHVRPQGSNSVARFHPASDSDDIDMTLVVDGDVNYAIRCREDFMAHKDHLENVVQSDLDVLVTPAGLESHEV